MVYAVIDTNVFVAALLTKNSDSATVKVYDAIANGKITPLYHKDILHEYAEVLSSPKFKFSEEKINAVLELIVKYGVEVFPKALFNAQYSKDISKKVHSAYMNQALKGKFTGCVAPFGYMKDPEDGTHLIIDEETAPYVRQMFEWALDGRGTAYIKRHLESNKVPCPTWWNRQRGIRNHYTKWELQDPENGKYVWDNSVIGDMLINPVYYGAVSAQKKNYKFKAGVRKTERSFFRA